MSRARGRSSCAGPLLAAALLVALLLVGVAVYAFLAAPRPTPPTATPVVAARVTPAPGATPAPAPAATPAPVTPGAAPRAPVEVFFTEPRYPDQPADRRGSLDERLTAFLKTARQSIDMAIYDLDLANVAQAMEEAHQRGVRVRVVTDTDNLKHEAVQRLIAAGVPVVDDKREAIMHHKFAVVDGSAVWMGSWNFTVFDTYRYNNNGALWRSQELAANYAAEFEKMFSGQFGPTKPKAIPHPVITVNDVRIETYFAAAVDPAPAIIRRLQGARRSITFMAYSFTHDGIGAAMLERGRRGVQVRGVFETTGSETRFSEYGRFKEAGFEVLQDGNPYLMHHKVIVIDETTVIFGSYNFSANASESNDENCLIVDDPGLARRFLEEYERVRAQALSPPARR